MVSWLKAQPFAHRGLHDRDKGVVENSPTAFEGAIQAGYGIELDVQLSRDGDAMVFHDRTLDRLTDETGPVGAYGTDALTQIALKDSSDKIPMLAEVLDQIGGAVPVLIEIKTMPREAPGLLEEAVMACVDAYDGPAAIMSFSPECVGWFRDTAPHISRGLVAMDFVRYPARLSWAERIALARLHHVRALDPDFVAYDCRSLPNLALRTVRSRGIPALSWTVRDQKTADKISRAVDQIIFEGFTPALS